MSQGGPPDFRAVLGRAGEVSRVTRPGISGTLRLRPSGAVADWSRAMVRPRAARMAAPRNSLPGETSMKKTIAAVLLAIAIPALASASDINPGALQLSGKSSFQWGTSRLKIGANSYDEKRVDGGISAMYYVAQFLAFGMELDYRSVEDDTSKSNSFMFGPKAGIDWELMRHFSVFADGAVGIVRAEALGETGDGYGLRLAGGFRLFFNSNVSLDLFGAYTHTQAEFPAAGKMSNNDFTAGLGLSVYLTNNPTNAEGYRPPPPAPGNNDYNR